MLLPLAVGGAAVLSAVALRHRSKNKGKMTSKRQLVFDKAMNSKLPPSDLEKLADGFKKEGLLEQAEALLKRAKLRALPKDIKDKRRKIYKDALKLKNPEQVNKIADAFQKEGATGAAKSLKDYAAGLPRK
jgi:hypothetical protein